MHFKGGRAGICSDNRLTICLTFWLKLILWFPASTTEAGWYCQVSPSRYRQVSPSRFGGTSNGILVIPYTSTRLALPKVWATRLAREPWAWAVIALLTLVWTCGFCCGWHAGSCHRGHRPGGPLLAQEAAEPASPSPRALHTLRRRWQAATGLKVSPLREGFALKDGAHPR